MRGGHSGESFQSLYYKPLFTPEGDHDRPFLGGRGIKIEGKCGRGCRLACSLDSQHSYENKTSHPTHGKNALFLVH